MNWLQSLIYGLLSGLTEFFPVCSQTHRQLLLVVLGAPAEESGLLFAARIGCFAAAVVATFPLINKLLREYRFASIPQKRRKRQPDIRSIKSLRLLTVAVIPIMLSMFGTQATAFVADRLWLLALVLAVSGVVLYIPQHLPSGNKDAIHLSVWDALMVGLAGAVGVVPGLSRIGMMTSVAGIRSADRRYSLDMCLLLCIPVLLVLSVMDAAAFAAAGTISLMTGLRYLCCAAVSFGGAYLSIFTMRFLAFRSGFSGFAYYCWAVALSTFILYLTI